MTSKHLAGINGSKLDDVLLFPGVDTHLSFFLGPFSASRLSISSSHIWQARICFNEFDKFYQTSAVDNSCGADYVFEVLYAAKLPLTPITKELLINDIFRLTVVDADCLDNRHLEGYRHQGLLDVAIERRFRSVIPFLRLRGCTIQRWDCLAIEKPVQHDDYEMIAAYLDAGGDSNIRANAGRPLLMVAAAFHSEKVLRLFLERGADVNARSGFGAWTALMWAAHRDWETGCELLIAGGARLEDTNDHGLTAAAIAEQRGNLSLLKHLVSDKPAEEQSPVALAKPNLGQMARWSCWPLCK